MIIRKNNEQFVMIIQCKGINYDLLSEEEKMNLLTVLYNNEDFATIRKYREVFSSLFQDKGESLGRN